jgi:hypothetical protein
LFAIIFGALTAYFTLGEVSVTEVKVTPVEP